MTVFLVPSCKKEKTKEQEMDELLDKYEKIIDDVIALNTRLSNPRFRMNTETAAQIYQLMLRREKLAKDFDSVTDYDYTDAQKQRLEALNERVQEYYRTRKYGILDL